MDSQKNGWQLTKVLTKRSHQSKIWREITESTTASLKRIDMKNGCFNRQKKSLEFKRE